MRFKAGARPARLDDETRDGAQSLGYNADMPRPSPLDPARRRCLAAGAAWLAAPVSSQAAEAPLIADIIDIPPWGLRSADGRPAGVYADLMQMLAERSGCPLQLRLVPILRSIVDIGHNVSHLTMMLDRKDMNDAGLLLGTVTQLPVQVWLPLGSAVRRPEQLRGHTVAVLRGPTYHEGVQNDAAIAKWPVSSPRQQLEMLRSGRVDAALGVEQNFLVAARAMGLGADSFAPPLQLGGREVRLWLAPGRAGHRCHARLVQALQSLRQDGSIARRMADATADD